MKHIRIAFGSSLLARVMSIIMAYGLWNLLQNILIIEHDYTIPVCFYNQTTPIISAPETIHLTLKGPKRLFNSLDYKTLALHFNARHIESPQSLTISDGTIFVPNGLTVIHCNPTHVSVKLKPI